MPGTYFNYYFLNSFPLPVIEHDGGTLYNRLNSNRCVDCEKRIGCDLEKMVPGLGVADSMELFLLNTTYTAEILQAPGVEALRIPMPVTVDDASVLLLNCDPGTFSLREDYMPGLVDAAPIKNVCLVEDNYSIRAMIKSMLAYFNLTVYDFEKPEDALQQMTSAGIPCDLLITDFTMPGMDGMTLIDEACRNHLQVPTVMVSGNLSEEVVQRLHDIDWKMVSFIQKPFTLGILKKTLTLLDMARRYPGITSVR